MSRHLYMVGAAIGLKSFEGLNFDPALPYTGCRLCGEVFQSRVEHLRKAWSLRHAKTHTQREHELLAMSGCWCTAEAAFKFAPLGIIPITDMVLNEEVRDALASAPSIPCGDVQT